MIESISQSIARKIKGINPDETASVEVMSYSLGFLINFFSVIFLCMFVGWVDGLYLETATCLIAFGLLRTFSGGFHFKSLTLCVVFTTVVLSILPAIAQYVSQLILINLISSVLVIVFAPSGKKKSRLSPRLRMVLKCVSFLIVCSNFIIDSKVIALAFLVQSILLIRKGGE